MFSKLLTSAILATTLTQTSALVLKRQDCSFITVQAGDSCSTLANKCHLSPTDFTKLHQNEPNLCSSLMPNQRICCTSGNLPDQTPPANPDGTCKTTIVAAGDSCWTLTQKCNVPFAIFQGLHTAAGFCDTLAPSQMVCCSKGNLPDTTPQPNPDGTCKTYTVQAGDYCYKIASDHGITVDQLNAFNQASSSWFGCDGLQVGAQVCVSKGTLPAPPQTPTAA